MADLTPASAPPQLPDEPAHEYSAFLLWLPMTPRPAPHEFGAAEPAARNCWVQRAIAWEWQQRLRFEQRTPPEVLRDLVLDQIYTAAIEARKTLDSVAGSRSISPEGQATLERLTKLADVLKSVPAPTAPAVDTSRLTQAEREVVLEAQRIIESKGTK